MYKVYRVRQNKNSETYERRIPMSVTTITKNNFAAQVLNSEKPVLLDFWASWCGPCRMLSPIVDKIADENSSITVGKVNVDEQPELARQFGVMSIPTLIVFKNGKITQQSVGVRLKGAILKMIEA
ncbi:thioredoxin [Caproicibacterium sp. BJN0003]|uniref:thioredoxin n=1 Tax=Caproicibacterium sp. BJN0003 TaxID=2994078 RepID=UPI002B1CB1FA|nr:thioredoxin [Caproicibacterium sp. BJN0003]